VSVTLLATARAMCSHAFCGWPTMASFFCRSVDDSFFDLKPAQPARRSADPLETAVPAARADTLASTAGSAAPAVAPTVIDGREFFALAQSRLSYDKVRVAGMLPGVMR